MPTGRPAAATGRAAATAHHERSTSICARGGPVAVAKFRCSWPSDTNLSFNLITFTGVVTGGMPLRCRLALAGLGNPLAADGGADRVVPSFSLHNIVSFSMPLRASIVRIGRVSTAGQSALGVHSALAFASAAAGAIVPTPLGLLQRRLPSCGGAAPRYLKKSTWAVIAFPPPHDSLGRGGSRSPGSSASPERSPALRLVRVPCGEDVLARLCGLPPPTVAGDLWEDG